MFENNGLMYDENETRNIGNYLLSLLSMILFTGLLLSIYNNFIYVEYTVEGRSMESTLDSGQTVMVNNLDKDATYGDIIVFHHENEVFIKRVVAKSGDEVNITNGEVFVNGTLQSTNETYHNPTEREKALPDNMTEWSSCDISKNCTVPEGKMFVLGDNRYVSKDSRHIGFIDKKDIIGTVNKDAWKHKVIEDKQKN